MAKNKKETIKVTYTIDKEVSELIDKYNEETFVPKVKIIEAAVKEYLDKKKKRRE